MNEKHPLPQGWRWVRLGEVCEVISKGTTPTTYGHSFVSCGIPFLRAEDITGGPVELSSVAFDITKETHDFLNRSKLRPGDLLITIAGSLGRAGYIPEGFPEANCNQAVAFARVDPIKADVKFLCHVLQVPEVLSPFTELKAGGTIQNLNLEQVRSIEIPLPPFSEQRRIAARVQELIQEVERARAACEGQLEAAKALPTAYLREVFESEEAKKWERKRLGEVCDIDSNQVLPNTAHTRQLPYIGLEHIESGTGKIIGTINDQDGILIQSITFRFDSRHVFYGKLRPYLNKVATPDFEGRCTTELVPLLPKDGCDRYYLAWLLRRAETVEEAMRHKTGTRMPRADMGELFEMLVPLPPLPEQKRIAAELKEKMAQAERLRLDIEKQLEAINALPQAILRKAFRGEL